MSATPYDAGLLHLLDVAAEAGVEVQVVYHLTKDAKGQTGEIVSLLLDRAERATGARPGRFKVFDLFRSFVIQATAPVCRFLLDQPEIASATANQCPEGLHISPRA